MPIILVQITQFLNRKVMVDFIQIVKLWHLSIVFWVKISITITVANLEATLLDKVSRD